MVKDKFQGIEMNWENMLKRYGNPIKIIELISKEEYTLEDEISEKPYKIAIFNANNNVGIVIYSLYDLDRNIWERNYGKDWCIKFLLEEVK